MDWMLFWTILSQGIISSLALRVIVFPWQSWRSSRRLAYLEAEQKIFSPTKTNKIL
jgi:hypothetical protein